MAQVTARYWMSQGESVPRDAASRLIGQALVAGARRLPEEGRGRAVTPTANTAHQAEQRPRGAR
nr:hypothetical protein [Angustibacter aerolatus]